MLSLETAKKLKDAGLKWEPQKGDQIFNPYYGEPEIATCPPPKAPNYIIWIPRLGQLLAEIEKRMYQWELTSYSALPPVLEEEGYPRTYKIQLFDEEGQVYEIGDMANIFNTGEAAALALLWILEQEAIA